ncbi:hypothetical protein LTR81_007890 [Elasticomyces elasticus]
MTPVAVLARSAGDETGMLLLQQVVPEELKDANAVAAVVCKRLPPIMLAGNARGTKSASVDTDNAEVDELIWPRAM